MSSLVIPLDESIGLIAVSILKCMLLKVMRANFQTIVLN